MHLPKQELVLFLFVLGLVTPPFFIGVGVFSFFHICMLSHLIPRQKIFFRNEIWDILIFNSKNTFYLNLLQRFSLNYENCLIISTVSIHTFICYTYFLIFLYFTTASGGMIKIVNKQFNY